MYNIPIVTKKIINAWLLMLVVFFICAPNFTRQSFIDGPKALALQPFRSLTPFRLPLLSSPFLPLKVFPLITMLKQNAISNVFISPLKLPYKRFERTFFSPQCFILPLKAPILRFPHTGRIFMVA
jgi:hypothetical protein